MTPLLGEGQLVLFQGDSITDCGRDRDNPEGLGGGYAAMTAAWFSARYPERRVRFLNRGISGHRAKDLRARWQADTLDLKPDWVSIMIGINDTWRSFDSNDPTGTEEYERDFNEIARQSHAAGSRLIIIEPYVLPVPADRIAWRKDLDPKIAAARRIAVEFGALYVPLDGLFAAAATRREPAFWAADGVHPTPAGHALIAQAWLQTVKA